MYQEPGGHANISAELFTTTAPGWRRSGTPTWKPKGPETERVSRLSAPKITPRMSSIRPGRWRTYYRQYARSSCNDGYLFDGEAANYDPEGLVYDPATKLGRVFSINEGPVEMWWYEKETTRQENPSNVCWPVRPVITIARGRR